MGTLSPRRFHSHRARYGVTRPLRLSDICMPMSIIILCIFFYTSFISPSTSIIASNRGSTNPSRNLRTFQETLFGENYNDFGYKGSSVGNRMPCNDPCQGMELDLYVQEVAQRQFCVRQYYNGSATVPDYLSMLELECHTGVKTNGPEAYQTVKLYGYKGQQDKVSRIIRKDKRWENDIQKAVARMMKMLPETKWKNAAKEELFLIDVGGNVGAHTMCASGLGYSTIVFEPLLANEIAIRSAVCENKLEDLVTLVPKGLGEAQQVCQIISDTANIGDGVTRCNNPRPPPIPYQVRGSFEMMTLDQALYCPYKERRRKIGAVKIDVESHETFVIRGGRRFFEEMQVPLITYENGGMSFDRRKEILEYFLGLGYYYTCAGKGREVFNAYSDKVIDCWDLILYHAEFVLRDDAGLPTKKKNPKFVLMEGL